MNEHQLTNKVALVTGASSGLGAHFAKTLSKAGTKVIVAARRANKLNDLVEEIKAAGGEAIGVSMDVTNADSVEKAIKVGEQALGSISVLVNNAGVADSRRFINVTEEQWDFVMDANLKGAWRVANAISRRMVANNIHGSIVNIASILGLRQGFGESTYAISKAAVVQMTKSMALELGYKGIRTNALCPGYFNTEMTEEYFNTDKGKAYIQQTPSRRLGKLEELDGALLLLCGKGSSFINGAALPVDGGHLVNSL